MIVDMIAHIETDFHSKFGVPRQSGLIPSLEARIVFEPPYRVPDALRGMEGFSHLWLLWHFSEVQQKEWRPTVRPPRLGGNKRMGVFATRSPFRPNPIGLSSVEIARIELDTCDGPIIWVKGADLMNGTPILDIKPYLPFTDSHPDARGGFTDQTLHQETLEVDIPESILACLSIERQKALREVLAQDPRPHYQQDPDRVYGMQFGGIEIRFRVNGSRLIVVERS